MVSSSRNYRLIRLSAGVSLGALAAISGLWLANEIGPVATVAGASTVWACVATLLALVQSSEADRDRVAFLTAAMRFSIDLPMLDRARFLKAILDGNTHVTATQFPSWRAFLNSSRLEMRKDRT